VGNISFCCLLVAHYGVMRGLPRAGPGQSNGRGGNCFNLAAPAPMLPLLVPHSLNGGPERAGMAGIAPALARKCGLSPLLAMIQGKACLSPCRTPPARAALATSRYRCPVAYCTIRVRAPTMGMTSSIRTTAARRRTLRFS
jgi:hypothetical protein